MADGVARVARHRQRHVLVTSPVVTVNANDERGAYAALKLFVPWRAEKDIMGSHDTACAALRAEPERLSAEGRHQLEVRRQLNEARRAPAPVPEEETGAVEPMHEDVSPLDVCGADDGAEPMDAAGGDAAEPAPPTGASTCSAGVLSASDAVVQRLNVFIAEERQRHGAEVERALDSFDEERSGDDDGHRSGHEAELHRLVTALSAEQQRVYKYAVRHIDGRIAGQMAAVCAGKAGTCKSRVLKSNQIKSNQITDAPRRLGLPP
jgi:hypothetical protein